jgi:nucleoside-diphosphate-sugar epimerase
MTGIGIPLASFFPVTLQNRGISVMTEIKNETVLVVGATGFLGPALVEELSIAGFKVVCGVRNLKKAASQLPFANVSFLKIDLNRDLDSQVWLPRLQEHNISRVVNNVGIATSLGGQSLENVNILAPLALFKAMQTHTEQQQIDTQSSVFPKVIQISTTGVEWPDCEDFPYPASKLKLDKALSGLTDLSSIIIRPNVIYEPARGHLLLEQIARMPINFTIGNSAIQPVHCRELAIGVARLLQKELATTKTILRATGPVPLTWKEIFENAANSLGKKYICSCSVPLKLAQFVTMMIQQLPEKILIRLGILSKMDPATMVMMTKGSTGSNKDWIQATNLQPIKLEECYQQFTRGSVAYATFIDSVRHSSGI